jgi:CspA family cold shock protein
MKGIVKWYNIRRGYGFIQCEDGNDVFVHKSEVPFWTIFLSKGDHVEFRLESTKRGNKATDVRMQ